MNKIGIGLLLLGLGVSACSSSSKKSDEGFRKEVREQAFVPQPVIIDVRANPQVVVLTEDLATSQPIRIRADIKSVGSPLEKVKLRLSVAPEVSEESKFLKRPIELEMKYMGGTTWQAELTKEEIKSLAVSGKELRYSANVIAQNRDGQVAMSSQPVEIKIQAPPALG